MNRKRWRCFHCDEVFRSVRLAEEHFGDEMYSRPACQIGGLRPMITLIRDQEKQLRIYRSEDTSLLRTLWSIEGEHARELILEEEKGYAKGLRDGRVEEREACAREADNYDQGPGDDSAMGPVMAGQVYVAQSIAAAIRARGDAS